MLVAAGYKEKISRADALLAGLILIQIRTLENDDADLVRVRVCTSVKAGLELRKGSVGALGGIAPDDFLGDAFHGRIFEGSFARRDINDFVAGLLDFEKA